MGLGVYSVPTDVVVEDRILVNEFLIEEVR
jgi:hypothetical protein